MFNCGRGDCATHDAEWWTPVLPQHPFLRDGLVHLTNPWSQAHALCGEEGVPYGVSFCSTDEARAYGRMLADLRNEVTCFQCISLDFLHPHGYM